MLCSVLPGLRGDPFPVVGRVDDEYKSQIGDHRGKSGQKDGQGLENNLLALKKVNLGKYCGKKVLILMALDSISVISFALYKHETNIKSRLAS